MGTASQDGRITALKTELATLEKDRLKERSARVWDLVSHLDDDDLKLLARLIHIRFHGDGEDD